MGQGSTTLAGAGAAPQDNPPRQQPTEDDSSNQERGGGKGNVPAASPVCIYSARGGAPAALPLSVTLPDIACYERQAQASGS